MVGTYNKKSNFTFLPKLNIQKTLGNKNLHRWPTCLYAAKTGTIASSAHTVLNQQSGKSHNIHKIIFRGSTSSSSGIMSHFYIKYT